MASTISAIVHAKNSAQTLTTALSSLSFVNEIIVVDMDSSDETLNIAEKFKAKVAHFKDVGFVEPARNYGLSLATKDWILILDADEEIPTLLQKTLIELTKTESEVVGYYLPRQNVIFGKWIAHSGWWPDYQLRFFKKGSVTWPETIHAKPIIDGQTDILPALAANSFRHHNYQTVDQFIDRLNRYTAVTAQSNSPQKLRDKDFSEAELFRVFSQQFLSRYFAQTGWKDGAHGMGLALLQSMYELTVLLKKWQETGFEAPASDPEATFKELKSFQKQLNYWLADQQVKNHRGLARIWWQIRRKWLI